jgi:hypothetical protein
VFTVDRISHNIVYSHYLVKKVTLPDRKTGQFKLVQKKGCNFYEESANWECKKSVFYGKNFMGVLWEKFCYY